MSFGDKPGWCYKFQFANIIHHQGIRNLKSKSCYPQVANFNTKVCTICKQSSVQGLTHWGQVTHICVSEQTIIGSDNGLSPGRRQAIIWTNAGILLIGPLGTKFKEILIKILAFSFKKVYSKMSSGKWRPFCLGLNVLIINAVTTGRSRQVTGRGRHLFNVRTLIQGAYVDQGSLYVNLGYSQGHGLSFAFVRISHHYRKTSNISRTLVGNKIVDNSDVVGASPIGAAPTTSSFST